jgi:hypothetical protein
MESKSQRETAAIAAGSKTDCAGGLVCDESILAEAASFEGKAAASSHDEERAKFRNKKERKRKRAVIAARFKKSPKYGLVRTEYPKTSV